ncbi:hypothetical protein ACWDSJ_26115 [Nocardia sp. NPDC003482]
MTTSILALPLTDANHTQLSPKDLCDLLTGPGGACTLGSDAAGYVGKSALEDLVKTIADGLALLIRLTMTWWLQLPSPQLASETGEPGPVLVSIRDYTSGLQLLLMIGGILFAAARLALAKRGGLAGEAQESFLIFARGVFASMLFAAAVTSGTKAGDAFSHWVIFEATDGDLAGAMNRLVSVDPLADALGTGVLLFIGIVGVISMLIQLVMLVLRQAMLVLVVAVLPIAAAAAGTGPGSQAWKRLLGWSLAFVLWKPVGALMYAIAFTAAGNTKEQDPQLILLGMILLVSVTLVLPALMRLVAPAVATLGGGGGAAGTLAGGALGLAMGSAGSGGGSSGRAVSEGENAPNGSAPPPPSSPSSSSGRGGRPMPGGGGSGGAAPAGGGGGGARAADTGSGRQAAAQSGAGASTAAAGAGPVGAAVAAGAQAGRSAGQQASSAAGGAAQPVGEAERGADAPGPWEVRR